MCTYLKNMEGKKPKDLKNQSFDFIQKMFDRAFKRVNTFVHFRTELVEESSNKAEVKKESSSKRARKELEQESSKKQKLEEDKESEELKQCLEIVPDDGDDVTIDAIPFVTHKDSRLKLTIRRSGRIEMKYSLLSGSLLHRSSINNSASLSNKFGESYFIFKFGISGLLHQVVTAIADRIQD
ncbi:hypothetical protein Tco_0817467, partial [Tanacetum coccineum]